MVWANERGDISVITAGKSGIRYRLRMSEPLAGPIIYTPTTDPGGHGSGTLYSFDMKNGQMMWRYASGDATAQAAAIVGDRVFLMTRDNGVHAISTETGLPVWPSPYDAAAKVRGRDGRSRLLHHRLRPDAVLDAETGHQRRPDSVESE